MNKREKTILPLAVGIAGLYLLDTLAVGPWLEKWDKVNAEIRTKRTELADAQRLLMREAEIRERWDKLKGQLGRDGHAKTTEDLLVHMNELERRADVALNTDSTREVPNGNFVELSLQMSLRASIEELRDLLVELYNSEELLRVRGLSVSANPGDRSRKLEIRINISTVRYEPEKS